MRDKSIWHKQLCEPLRRSDTLQEHVTFILPNSTKEAQRREVARLARLIADVELGLTLLTSVAPQDPATSVSALLSGYHFPVESLQSETNWVLVQKARFYLIHHKGRQWLRSLQEYITLPPTIRIYSLNTPNQVPHLIPSSIYPRRLQQVYLPTLTRTPPHAIREVKLASEGRWFCKVFQGGHSPVEIPIWIPPAVARLAPSPEVTLERTREACNPPRTVTLEKLLRSAQEMDQKLSEAGHPPEDYYGRMSITLELRDAGADDFHPGVELNLDKLVHIVGLLNVGKSTLLEVLIYHFANQGYRCALIVNEVVTAVRIASLFKHKLDIPAAPILGSDRPKHLEQIYQPILQKEGEEIATGAMHPALEWFSSVCPLLALVQSEETWAFGQEPCHDLYTKAKALEQGNALEDDEEDREEGEDEEKYTCPVYYKCPRHQLERDIATALVWVLTPGSFIHTRTPRQVFAEKLAFAEAVYRECDFLFVDEADRVQVRLDEEFAPNQVLVDASGTSFLNKVGLSVAAIYNSDRSNMAADRFVAWTSAQYHAQNATNRIYHLLLTQPKLVEWLGQYPFTGYSVFTHIIRDLLVPPNEEGGESSGQSGKTRQERSAERHRRIEEGLPLKQRRRRKALMRKLEGFLQYPLNRYRGGNLSDLAFALLSAQSDRQALAEVEEWCKKWLEANKIPMPDATQFEELTRNIHFAVLTTVLDNQLGFLVDHIAELRQSHLVDLHDLSQALVHRPPLDYLPVVPDAPVGNILGFLYKRDRSNFKKGGKLEYFRYVGIGRALLLNFPILFGVDGLDGPHTVLISGTSYAPGSPAYHIRIEPTVLLKPRNNDDSEAVAGIRASEFFFRPQKRLSDREPIKLSGLPLNKRRKAAVDLIEAMCDSSGQVPSFLEEVFRGLKDKAKTQPEWWSDRQRILIVTGSYDEADWVGATLRPLYRVENVDEDGIVTLRRDNAPAHPKSIRRGEIQDLRNLPAQIVIAPLMALERGHNILNELGKAAFGAVLFLNRPMPVPDDWQATVRQLNDWALEHQADPPLSEVATKGKLTLAKAQDIFYRKAVSKMLDLNCTAFSFRQLTEDERKVLCWTQLVSIWQIIGRLVRGGVPAEVYFLDAKFAPKSAEGLQDKETTSLLVGIIKSLQPYVEGEDKRPYEQHLAESLYGIFLNALKQTEELRHDL